MKIERISNARNEPFQNSHSQREFPLPPSHASLAPGLEANGNSDAPNDGDSGGNGSAHVQVAAFFEDELLDDQESTNDSLERWLERLQHARRLDLRL